MTHSSPIGRKTAAALAALILGTAVTMGAPEVQARDGRKGALIAAGVLGALAVGAIAASARDAHAGHDGRFEFVPEEIEAPAPAYHQPMQYHPGYSGPGYIQPGYGYRGHPAPHAHRRHRHPGYAETGYGYRGPVCTIRKQSVFDGYGWRVRRVEVCR